MLEHLMKQFEGIGLGCCGLNPAARASHSPSYEQLARREFEKIKHIVPSQLPKFCLVDNPDNDCSLLYRGPHDWYIKLRVNLTTANYHFVIFLKDGTDLNPQYDFENRPDLDLKRALEIAVYDTAHHRTDLAKRAADEQRRRGSAQK